jgi:hypothetical protein
MSLINYNVLYKSNSINVSIEFRMALLALGLSGVIGLVVINGLFFHLHVVRVDQKILVDQHGGLVLGKIVLHGDICGGHHSVQSKRVFGIMINIKKEKNSKKKSNYWSGQYQGARFKILVANKAYF